jgi:predicted ATPase/DNA-binding CsgD family transcriptional regulator
VSLTHLLGRDDDIAAAVDLLVRESARLVTLIGPGGIGKTRLAVGIAGACSVAFEHQVAWAPVATVSTTETVATALAHAVGLAETGSTPTIEALHAALRDARLLMVVDNFEQALDAAPLLTSLLQSCPGLSLLVTSRAVLRVEGEQPFEVPPLATRPEPTDAAVTSDIAPAVRLFGQRAKSVLPSFELTAESIPIVGEVCRRLDGLPLAIELAAARINHLPLRDLRDRLDSGLAMLAGGTRDMPPRHRTMRDAIAWSYDLLGEEEQALFRKLAVFVGGFTLAALEAVSGRDVLPALGGLVDNSLVRLEPLPHADARYSMLETVREFAAEQLATSGEDTSRQRHAEYYLALALQVERTYWGDEPGEMRRRVRAEEANLRAAADWAIAHGDGEMATHLAVAMFDPLSHTGDNARELITRLQQALAQPVISPPTRAFALTRWAAMVELDKLAEGTELAEEAVALARQHDDAFGIAEALRVLGNIAIHTGDDQRARSSLLEALARFRGLGLKGRAGWTLHHLSALAGLGPEPDPALAAAYCDEALAIFRELGHRRGIEATLNWHSECSLKLRDLPKALASAQEGLEMISPDSWSSWSYDYLDRLADIAMATGNAKSAARLYGAAYEQRERAGRPIEPAFRPRHEARIAVARRALGEDSFAAAWAAGQALSQHQVETEAHSVSIAAATDAADAEHPLPRLLSPRERDVMRLLAAGLSDQAIANELFIGERTVNTHVAHIFAKLGVRNRAAAVTAAMAAGLIEATAGETRPD